MPEFEIEREILGAGKSSPEQLKGISYTFCRVLGNMSP